MRIIVQTNQRQTMAVVEENWQTKCSAIAERSTNILNTGLLSSVKFVVPPSTSESETEEGDPSSQICACNQQSCVLCHVLWLSGRDHKTSVEMSDCNYQSLLEMFDYLYSDQVNLSGSNVIQVLYLVPTLAEKCAEYLRRYLKASNVFRILPHAQKFENKD